MSHHCKWWEVRAGSRCSIFTSIKSNCFPQINSFGDMPTPSPMTSRRTSQGSIAQQAHELAFLRWTSKYIGHYYPCCPFDGSKVVFIGDLLMNIDVNKYFLETSSRLKMMKQSHGSMQPMDKHVSPSRLSHYPGLTSEEKNDPSLTFSQSSQAILGDF